jgi:hypothetical protein
MPSRYSMHLDRADRARVSSFDGRVWESFIIRGSANRADWVRQFELTERDRGGFIQSNFVDRADWDNLRFLDRVNRDEMKSNPNEVGIGRGKV